MPHSVVDVGSHLDRNLERWSDALRGGGRKLDVFNIIYSGKRGRWTAKEISAALGGKVSPKTVTMCGKKLDGDGLIRQVPDTFPVVYEKLKDVHHYKAKILARVKAKIKGRAKPAVQATPQQALRRSKSVGNGDVELGKKIVERILTEMSQSRGLKLSKVNWMYDSSRMIYWFDFELDGEPKKWQVSYEAITDSVKDKEALRKIERGLAMYVFPDEPGTTVPPPSPKVVPRATRASVPQPQPSALDVFVCHASEDKPFVDQLVTAMKDAGITVWYDTDKLSWGDDLRRSIAMGLLNSRYGIVVLSGAFLARKRWTEHELDGLFAKERGGEKVILPIWHGITADDLAKYNLQFIDKKAMDSSKDSVPAMVQGLKHLLGK